MRNATTSVGVGGRSIRRYRGNATVVMPVDGKATIAHTIASISAIIIEHGKRPEQLLNSDQDLIAMWEDYATRYAAIDAAKADRFRRLAGQMRDIVANDRSTTRRTINVREPGVPPPPEPRGRRKRPK